MKKLVLLLTLLSLNLLSAKEIYIKILGTSDIHGRIIPWNYGTDDEDKSGSLSQIDTYVTKVRKNNRNVILVDIGDFIQDNSIDIFAIEKSKNHPAPKLFNKMKFDYFVLGNHEFNFGMDKLSNILDDMKTKTLTANLYEKGTNKRYVDANDIKEIDGVKIGFFGLTTPMSQQFEEDTGYLDDYYFSSSIEEAKRQVEELKSKGADIIVLLAHMGVENENNIPETGVEDIIKSVDGIDVAIIGHMHRNIPKQVINNTVVTEPHRYGTVVSEVDIILEKDEKNGNVITKSIDSKTVSVENEKSSERIDKIYNPYHKVLRNIANEVIGETENDMVPYGKDHGISLSFAQDTGLSTFITTAQLYYSNADVVSFSYNYETVKMDKGPIKRKDIAYNYRYTGGDVSVYQMTGKQLKKYMEWSADYFDTIQDGDTEYRYNKERAKSKYVTFDIFGGVKYNIDLRNEKGNKITNLTLEDGTKITDDMILKVGMNSYRFEQLIRKGGIFEGENIPLLWSSKDELGQDDGRIQMMMINYIKDVKNGKIEGLSKNNWRIIGL